jgi:excisionase family DNA binding protein
VGEAAAALHLSANTVRSLCARRRLRHERHGIGRGVIRIPEDAIEEYRRSVTVASEPAKANGKPARPRVKPRHLSLD